VGRTSLLCWMFNAEQYAVGHEKPENNVEIAPSTNQPQENEGEGLEATSLREDSDHALIAACCAGNKQAFNGLVLRHQDSVSTLATRLLGDQSEAEDITQDTFLRAYEKITEFRGEAKFSTWLYRICRNLCLNCLQKKKNDPTCDAESGTLPEELPDPRGRFPDHALMKKERQHLIQRALSPMAQEFREVLVLYHTIHLSYEEIAELLRLPVGTVRSRLHRGRKELRERLHPSLPEA